MDEYTIPIQSALQAYEADPSPETLEALIQSVRAWGAWCWSLGARRFGIAADAVLAALHGDNVTPEIARAQLVRAGETVSVNLTGE